jgi:hypothetical protein
LEQKFDRFSAETARRRFCQGGMAASTGRWRPVGPPLFGGRRLFGWRFRERRFFERRLLLRLPFAVAVFGESFGGWRLNRRRRGSG